MTTKWPKEWMEALSDMECKRAGEFVEWDGKKHVPCQSHDDRKMAPIFILDRLYSVGALKEPPKTDEFWECTACGFRCSGPVILHTHQYKNVIGEWRDCGAALKHYREVIE